MDKLTQYLREWALHYIKSRDLIHRNIVNIADNEDGFVVELKDGKQCVIVEAELNADEVLSKLSAYKGQKSALFVYNTQQNLEKAIASWKKLAEFDRHFMMVFVNPFSSTEHKWSFFPMTHHTLSDKAENALRVLASSVEIITEEKLEKNIR